MQRINQIRQPSGTTLTGIVPTNTYPCKDGKHVIIGGNGDSIYVRLMNAIGRSDLVSDLSSLTRTYLLTMMNRLAKNTRLIRIESKSKQPLMVLFVSVITEKRDWAMLTKLHSCLDIRAHHG